MWGNDRKNIDSEVFPEIVYFDCHRKWVWVRAFRETKRYARGHRAVEIVTAEIKALADKYLFLF